MVHAIALLTDYSHTGVCTTVHSAIKHRVIKESNPQPCKQSRATLQSKPQPCVSHYNPYLETTVTLQATPQSSTQAAVTLQSILQLSTWPVSHCSLYHGLKWSGHHNAQGHTTALHTDRGHTVLAYTFVPSRLHPDNRVPSPCNLFSDLNVLNSKLSSFKPSPHVVTANSLNLEDDTWDVTFAGPRRRTTTFMTCTNATAHLDGIFPVSGQTEFLLLFGWKSPSGLLIHNLCPPLWIISLTQPSWVFSKTNHCGKFLFTANHLFFFNEIKVKKANEWLNLDAFIQEVIYTYFFPLGMK